MKIPVPLSFAVSAPLAASLLLADEKPLFNGKNLDGWGMIGDGQWTAMSDGTLLGQRIGDYRKMFVPGGPLPTPQQFKAGVDTQSWLYTKHGDFGEFDLHLEYWTKTRRIDSRFVARQSGRPDAAGLHAHAIEHRL